MKTVNLDRKFAAAIVALILISTAIGALLVQQYFPQIGTIKAEGMEDPLEAWSEASYIIWQYNSTFYACRNMSTWEVEPLDSNKTYVQQMAIGNLTTDIAHPNNGGTIYLKEVTLNTSLTYDEHILIIEAYQGLLTFYRGNAKVREIGDCPTVTSGTFVLTSDTSEHTIIELTPSVVTYIYNFWLDLNALTQNCTIKVYSKIDGTNYREMLSMRLADLPPEYAAGMVLKEQIINTAWKMTIQSSVAEGASRSIPYRYFTEVWG
jgi:hypothetical protein